MRDSFYTEAGSAALLAASLGEREPKTVADFACGEGALLMAAYLKWPDSSFVGVDIDGNVSGPLSARVPSARFICADFLEEGLPDTEAMKRFDVILLNPPFSCPGSYVVDSVIGDRRVRCSRAMGFLAKSLTYLAPGGVIAVILPLSCIHSEKDAAAREALAHWYEFDIVPTATEARFHGCAVSTAVVHVTQRTMPTVSTRLLVDSSTSLDFEVSRGGRPNGSLGGQSNLVPFVHTTELRSNSVSLHRSIGSHPRDREIIGPAILLPRVGRPNRSKICLLERDVVVRISDCVIAIRHDDQEQIAALYEAILFDWHSFSAIFRGTCAPYTTLHRLRAYISSTTCLGRAAAA